MLAFLIHRLSQFCCLFSRRWVLAGASLFAGVLYFLYRLTPYRQFIYGNIQAALHLPPHQAHALARQHIKLLCWSIGDFLRFPLWAQTPPSSQELTIRGWHHLLQAHRQGRGVILVSAHFGLWELIPAVVSLAGIPMHTLVQKPSNASIDNLFRDFRAQLGIQTHNNDHLSGLRPALRALKQGEVIGLVIDQHGESNQVIGEFFEHTVSLPEGPVFFARHCRSEVVPVFTYREGRRHIVEFAPPYALPDNLTEPRRVQQMMQDLYELIEAQIRKYPQEWLWSYNRWDKYLPVQPS